MKIDWANYNDGSSILEMHYAQMDKSLYESQYSGNLYCVSQNCTAKIKFTERKDGTKFFSTMNKQGTSHENNCPYYLIYEGEVPRRRLVGGEIGSSVSDEHILNTLNNKSRSLKIREPRVTTRRRENTRRVIDAGQDSVQSVVDNGTIGENASRIRINSLNSNFVTGEYLGQRKCVFGKVINIEFNEEGYGSIRLENEQNQINVFFPPAFYADSRITTREALIAFTNTVRREIDRNKDLIVISVGMLEKSRDGLGININVISPSHFLINENKYYQVIVKGEVTNNPYN